MKQTIVIKRFTVGSLFKIVGVGVSISMILFTILCGVCALFGANAVRWNNQPVTGMTGLIASPFIGIFLALLFTIFAWVGFAFSFWLFGLFGRLELEYFSAETTAPPVSKPPPAPQ